MFLCASAVELVVQVGTGWSKSSVCTKMNRLPLVDGSRQRLWFLHPGSVPAYSEEQQLQFGWPLAMLSHDWLSDFDSWYTLKEQSPSVDSW